MHIKKGFSKRFCFGINFILLGIKCQKFDILKPLIWGYIKLKAFYVFEWKKFLKAKTWINRISFFNIRYEIARRYMHRIIIHTRITLGHVILLKCKFFESLDCSIRLLYLFRYKHVQCISVSLYIFICFINFYHIYPISRNLVCIE